MDNAYYELIAAGRHRDAYDLLRLAAVQRPASQFLVNEALMLLDTGLLRHIAECSKNNNPKLHANLNLIMDVLASVNSANMTQSREILHHKMLDLLGLNHKLLFTLAEHGQIIDDLISHPDFVDHYRRIPFHQSVIFLQFLGKWRIQIPDYLLEKILGEDSPGKLRPARTAVLFAASAGLIPKETADPFIATLPPDVKRLYPLMVDTHSEIFTGQEYQELTEQTVIIHFACWGASYINRLLAVTLCSMIVSGQLQDLCDKYDVVVVIDTTRGSAAEIQRAVVDYLRDFPLRVMVSDSILANEVVAKSLFGFVLLQRIRQAAAKSATFISLGCDVLVGRGLAGLVRNCPPGGVAAVPNIRICPQPALESLISSEYMDILYASEGNGDLLSHSADFWYHLTQRQLFGNCLPGNHFKVADDICRLSARSMLPIVMKPDKNLLSIMREISAPRYSNCIGDSFAQPIDHGLVGELWKRDLAYTPRSSDGGLLIEFSDARGYRNLLKGLEVFRSPTPTAVDLIFN